MLFLASSYAGFLPYLVMAQNNLNDNIGRCAYGDCPYSRGYGNGYWGSGMMGNMMGWGGMPFYGFFGGIISIVFWVLIVIAIVYLIKYLVWGGDHHRKMWMEEKMRMMKMRKGDSAMAILKERYAKGEIDKKEFEEKIKELKNL